MCISDNPASRNFRKDTELWITQGLHYLKSLVTSQAAPGTEVSVLSLDPVGGKSVGEGRRQGRCQLKKKKKRVSNNIGRCLLTRWLGKLPPRRSPFYLLPNSQYERVRSSLGNRLRRTTLQVYQKAQGVAHGHRLNSWLKFLWKKQNRTRHTHTPRWLTKAARKTVWVYGAESKDSTESFSIHQLVGHILLFL